MKSEWIRVSAEAPCPICKKPDWCGFTSNGTAVCCMRVESDRPLHNGGWLHRIGPLPSGMIQPKPPMFRRPVTPDFDAAAWLARLPKTQWDSLRALACSLGVGIESVQALGAAWAPLQNAWAWPMRDAKGKTIGVRLRADDGRKWAVTGSRQGLFYNPAIFHTHAESVMICEGPTDTAAALTLGFEAIGRPSCNCGVELIRELIQRRGFLSAVIMADRDGPGVAGARRLASELGKKTHIVLPPCKDLREWVKAGVSVETVLSIIRNQLLR